MTTFLAQYFWWVTGLLTALLFIGVSGVAAKKESLLWRFWSILVVGLLAGVIAWAIPPRLGIDLAGGTSLLYELDLSKLEAAGGGHESTESLAGRVIEVLKKRVDPYGQKNMIWRVVGGKRIQIQMPQADKATTDAKLEEVNATKELQASTLKMSEVLSAISRKGADREAAIGKLQGATAEQAGLIREMAAAKDALDAARAAKAGGGAAAGTEEQLLAKIYDAQQAFDAAQGKLKASTVDAARLTALITATDNPKNVEAQKELADLIAKHQDQKGKIERVVAAHRRVMELSGGGVDDSVELQRLLTTSGVLDFRIAVVPSEVGGGRGEEYQAAMQSLEKYGPDRAVTVNGTKARWFEIDQNSKDNFMRGDYVMSSWASRLYLLCYDDPIRSLTHTDTSKGKAWSVTAVSPYADTAHGGAIVLPFRLDAAGGSYMGSLTSANMHHPMAILLDDKAITAPNINGNITTNGEITFGTPSAARPMESIKKEAEQLKQIMDAGSLPATLQSQPISVVEITPDMGKENIERGVQSAYYAVAAVVGFMMVYYTITGLFANLALMLNLLLVLAAMAIFRGTFTLPGIAGLVLTLGMAVDANVLINERIREEIHKGASLWMAIKQGYDKVFWTIFDANLTTSLTSIVLIYVGSEEVKGFGVTLFIGLIIHMFTALFVTRTLMMAAVRWGILRAIDDHSIGEYFKELFTFTWLRNGHWPFMRVITVTNIDWIGKRYIFWGISAVITVAGLVAFVARGEDKYDIEFRGGTQVTLDLKKADASGKYLTREDVEARIKSLAELPGLKDLQSVRVYGVGKPEEHRFEMQTTINNPRDNPNYVKTALLDPLAKKFADVLDVKRAVKVAYLDRDEKQQLTELLDKAVVRPIKETSLDQVFANSDWTGVPNQDVTAFLYGTAVMLDQIDPPQTAEQLRERIQNMRTSSEGSAKAPYRSFDILPLTAVTGGGMEPGMRTEAATAGDKRPLRRAVMVSVDPAQLYEENTETVWQSRVAQGEWGIVRAALSNEQLFQGVTTFDAVVADQAKQQALVAIVLSLVLIVVYVWLRFGGIRYGIGAILSLAHDAIVALAATVLSGVVYQYVFGHHDNFLLLSDFKINLTMIAAYLTIIGYSVNDTIVIFDRVRELRGRSTKPLSAQLINDAINQCFGRTIWTTFTVFIVVLIMYIWGGEGVRGFSFAMLIGVITGAYSTLAIASPMLLTTANGAEKGGSPTEGAKRVNPFLKKEEGKMIEASPVMPQSDGLPRGA